jgi:phenylalanyl-tRNA synthetase beta subunit
MLGILKRLGFGIKGNKVSIPLFRAADIYREIDLIEEIARIYGYDRIQATMPGTAFPGKEEDLEDIFRNKIREVMAGCGLYEVQTYSMLGPKEVDYFFMKGMLENLFCALGIGDLRFIEAGNNPLLQPGRGAEVEGLGIVGELHPDIQANYGFEKRIVFFEIDLGALFRLAKAEKRYRPLPKFPSVSRDISMFIPAGLENQKIIGLIEQTGGELVEDVFPFDKFKDSTAYRVIYRNPERTLTEEEVNKKHQGIVQELTSKLKVRVR